MKTTRKYIKGYLFYVIFPGLCFFSFVRPLSAQDISVAGTWNLNISASDVSEAGLDFPENYESLSNQATITITGVFFNLWSVDIKKMDTDWNPSLILSARRTTDGSGGFLSFITGGTNYQVITNVDQDFFNGFRNRSNIAIQYQLSGVSVTLPAKNYSTTIVYTVTSP